MKYRFLLDENILHFAIKGINERDESDETSTELVRHIASNCHRIVLNQFIIECYWKQLNKIQGPRTGSWMQERISFINGFLHKAEKLSFESNECPDLPHGTVVPAEDVDIVKFALLTKANVVTGDGELLEAINRHPQLGFRALHPRDAIVLALET